MKLVDLCSGYGGFSVAFERHGCETVAFAEIEPFACRVLAHHWPSVPNLGDLRNISGRDVRADIVTAGFPCQDLSVAGKRAGLAGERSGLFYEITRIVREMREAGNGQGKRVAVFIPEPVEPELMYRGATILVTWDELRSAFVDTQATLR